MPGTGRHRLSRRTKIATAALGLALAAGALVIATTVGRPGAASAASGGRISCPDVAAQLPAIPASAQAEVQRNLALLDTQVTEADNRLATSAGQGGPNFVQNAILGPLKDKRASTIDRIAIAIGRQGTKPQNLGGLATCSLGGQAPSATTPASNTGAAAAGRITCPDVASQLPAIPASAQAEVQRNLDLLKTQIAEADNRLVTSAGEGGPNFVQNAILGPLEDKRVATIDRIATAIGRTAAKPRGLDALAPCSR
ncbi:hypothetical protein [Amycolatopsis sp. NPDC004378]